jgi:3-oxoacyl-[acyl-carrier protein] reductase
MDLQLTNKVAVVLAASGGIGRGIASVLAQEGCTLAICARGGIRLTETANAIRSNTGAEVFANTTDVSDPVALESFLEQVLSKFGQIDILVNNTGGPKPGKCLELTDSDYIAAFNQILMSKIRACRKAVPSMVRNGWGRILNVESTSAKIALENMVLSNTFRAASAAFAKTLSMEYARSGIRVHTLLSGPFLTDRVTELGTIAAQQRQISLETWRTEAEANTPLGRFGDPEEYGALVAFLASDRAAYLNGCSIAIDGGQIRAIT